MRNSADRLMTADKDRRQMPAGAKPADEKAALSQLAILVPFLRPYRHLIAGAVLSILLVSAALLSMGRGLSYLVDAGLGGDNPALLNRAVLVTLGIALILAFGSYMRTSLINQVGEKVMADVRRAVFAHLMGLSTAWFETARTGDVLARLTSDTALVQAVMTSSLSMAARNVILLIGGLILVVVTSAKMSLVVAIVVPVVVLPLIILGRQLRRSSRLAQEKLGDVSVYAEESLTAIRTVHAFAQEGAAQRRFDFAVNESLSAALSRVRLRGLLSGLVIFAVIAGIAAILWVGGRDLLAGEISAGELSAFVFYAFLVASATGALSELSGDLQRAAGAAERLAQLLQTKDHLPVPAMPQTLKRTGSVHVAFQNVHFAYASQQGMPALADISFQIAPGQRVALVGPSGAGKSTLFHLLLRFYDPKQGVITLNDIDISAMDPTDLRSHIGLVPQEPALFSTTIADNLRFSRPDASDAEIIRAAEQAQAHEFINQLPDGYQAMVGEKGVRLSGGQKQRLAIARAILRDPALLLLDEATSALDGVSEAAVQASLQTLMQGRTSLVIAHRLSTVIDADMIMLMDHGRIIDQGSHEDLIARSHLYQDLTRHQFAAFAKDEDR